MNTKIPDLYGDPFEERTKRGMHRDILLLGARIRFESNSEDLLRLVDSAYAGLARHKLSPVVPKLRVRLVLTSPDRKRASGGPAPLQMMSGGGSLLEPRGLPVSWSCRRMSGRRSWSFRRRCCVFRTTHATS